MKLQKFELEITDHATFMKYNNAIVAELSSVDEGAILCDFVNQLIEVANNFLLLEKKVQQIISDAKLQF